MDDTNLIRVIRAKLRSGALPRQRPVTTWGGPARGSVCAVCDAAIGPDGAEIEADSADGSNRFYHPACFKLLAAERARATG
jgi:hypothetical protein